MLRKEILKSINDAIKSDYTKALNMIDVFTNFCTLNPIGCDPIEIKDYFHQIWEAREDTIEDLYICSILWQRILNGNIKYIIQETPCCFSDKEIDKNRELVKSYVDCVATIDIIDADFWGGTQGADGFIKFKEPPIFRQTHFPLEIGYCSSDQFLYHIGMNNAIARLPYGKEYIIFFEAHPEGDYLKPIRNVSAKEIQKHLKIALKEIGKIKPIYDKNKNKYFCEHYLYPYVKQYHNREDECVAKYKSQLMNFIKMRLTGLIPQDMCGTTKGMAGKV